MTTFQLDASDAYWWPVELETIAAEGGKTVVQAFEIEFKRFNAADYADLAKAVDAQTMTDLEMAQRVCTGQFRGIKTGDVPLRITPENFERLLKTRVRGKVHVYHQVLLAWNEAELGGEQKNL